MAHIGMRGYQVIVVGAGIVYASSHEDGLLKIADYLREIAETPADQRHLIESAFVRGGFQIAELP